MRERFWADDFDLDLLSLWPGLESEGWLAAAANKTVWTYGNLTHRRLNHPAVWNMAHGSTAIFWRSRPADIRDRHGWVKLDWGQVTNSYLVEATWLEVLRDQWVHDYQIVLDGSMLFGSLDHQAHLRDRIMGHVRGYSLLEPGEYGEIRERAIAIMQQMTMEFRWRTQ